MFHFLQLSNASCVIVFVILLLAVSLDILWSFSRTLFPKCSRVCTCAAGIWSIVSSPFWTPVPTPKNCPPTAIVIQRLLFFPRVCSMCTVSFGECSEGSGWTRPHGAPDRVDTVAYPEAWQQPLKRGATEMDWAPGTDPLPCSPPPRLKRSRPSQLSSESSPSPAGYILLACILQLDVDYLPAARAPVWSGVAPERRPGTDFDMWPKIRSHQSWGRSPEIWRHLTLLLLSTLNITEILLE